MRKMFITALVACVAVLAACKAEDVTPGVSSSPVSVNADNTSPDGAPRVTIQQLQDLIAKNEAAVYDTRSRDDYNAAHIKGSLSMPVNEVENRLGELPKDKFIVFYCA